MGRIWLRLHPESRTTSLRLCLCKTFKCPVLFVIVFFCFFFFLRKVNFPTNHNSKYFRAVVNVITSSRRQNTDELNFWLVVNRMIFSLSVIELNATDSIQLVRASKFRLALLFPNAKMLKSDSLLSDTLKILLNGTFRRIPKRSPEEFRKCLVFSLRRQISLRKLLIYCWWS
jgi:hypothetical protein